VNTLFPPTLMTPHEADLVCHAHRGMPFVIELREGDTPFWLIRMSRHDLPGLIEQLREAHAQLKEDR
jgi:hypothetical protein